MKRFGLVVAGLMVSAVAFGSMGAYAGADELGAGDAKQQMAKLSKDSKDKQEKLNKVRERLIKADPELGKAKEELDEAAKEKSEKVAALRADDPEYTELAAKAKELNEKKAEANKGGDAAGEKAAVEELGRVQASISKCNAEYEKHPDLNKVNRVFNQKNRDFQELMAKKLNEDPEGASLLKGITADNEEIARIYNNEGKKADKKN